jgi:hypothetical protein
MIRLFVVLCLCINLASCHSKENDNTEKAISTGYSIKYNARITSGNLLLGCIVYSEETTTHLQRDSSSEFYRINEILHSYLRSGDNIDSLIDVFVAMHKNIDFRSEKAMFRIREFINNCNLVDQVIFGKIDSDDKSAEMKILEQKILKIPEAAIIYRNYVAPGNDLSSLSSSGYALTIQMAYYLSTLDLNERNEILKKLL